MLLIKGTFEYTIFISLYGMLGSYLIYIYILYIYPCIKARIVNALLFCAIYLFEQIMVMLSCTESSIRVIKELRITDP